MGRTGNERPLLGRLERPLLGRLGMVAPILGRTSNERPLLGRLITDAPMWERTGNERSFLERLGICAQIWGRTQTGSPYWGEPKTVAPTLGHTSNDRSYIGTNRNNKPETPRRGGEPKQNAPCTTRDVPRDQPPWGDLTTWSPLIKGQTRHMGTPPHGEPGQKPLQTEWT